MLYLYKSLKLGNALATDTTAAEFLLQAVSLRGKLTAAALWFFPHFG